MFPLLIEQFQVCDDVIALARFIVYQLLLVDTKPTTITVTFQAGAHQSQQLKRQTLITLLQNDSFFKWLLKFSPLYQ